MEWFYVWMPPLMIVALAAGGGLLIAWILPVRGVSLWLRWAVVAALLVLIPLVGRSAWRIGRRETHHPDT
jgi:hypothetical protein